LHPFTAYVVTTDDLTQTLDEHGLGKNPLGLDIILPPQDSKQKDKTNELAVSDVHQISLCIFLLIVGFLVFFKGITKWKC
jgi:hypothetical protein